MRTRLRCLPLRLCVHALCDLCVRVCVRVEGGRAVCVERRHYVKGAERERRIFFCSGATPPPVCGGSL